VLDRGIRCAGEGSVLVRLTFDGKRKPGFARARFGRKFWCSIGRRNRVAGS
jgi:hypothetical protein